MRNLGLIVGLLVAVVFCDVVAAQGCYGGRPGLGGRIAARRTMFGTGCGGGQYTPSASFGCGGGQYTPSASTGCSGGQYVPSTSFGCGGGQYTPSTSTGCSGGQYVPSSPRFNSGPSTSLPVPPSVPPSLIQAPSPFSVELRNNDDAIRAVVCVTKEGHA